MDIQINVKGTKEEQRPSDRHIVDRCANVLRQHGYNVEIVWDMRLDYDTAANINNAIPIHEWMVRQEK